MPKRKTPAVFCNASVILAGLKSPSGGSGKILQWGKAGRIKAVVSEVIVDEVLRNISRMGLKQNQVTSIIEEIFPSLVPAPDTTLVKSFYKTAIDVGDCHVLASSKENKADFLVTLDKRHLMVLKDKIKAFKVVSPGELIAILG